MSFVSVMANSKYISVVSDGRVMSDGEPVQEDYVKYKKISKNQFVAFAGSKEPCEEMVSQIDYYEDKIYDLKQVAEEINSSIFNKPHLDGYKLLFVVGGLNTSSQIEFFVTTHDTFGAIPYTPDNSEDVKFAYIFNSSEGNEDKDKIIDDEFHKISYKFGFNTANKCLRVQKEINNFIADFDISVNKRTSRLLIRKKN